MMHSPPVDKKPIELLYLGYLWLSLHPTILGFDLCQAELKYFQEELQVI